MRYLLLFGMFSVISFSEMAASPKPIDAAPKWQMQVVLCGGCDGNVGFTWVCVQGPGGCPKEASPCPGCNE